MNKRNENVQVLRALLSMVVITGHIYAMSLFKMNDILQRITRPLFDGNTAVLAFFIMSGYFMTYKVYENYETNIRSILIFSLKRLFRLLPLAWLSILLGFFLCNHIVDHSELNQLYFTEWGLDYWKNNFSVADLFMEMRMIKVIPSSNGLINPPIWTVMKEVKYAIVFPLLLFLSNILKQNIIKIKYGGAFISAIGTILLFLVFEKTGKLDFLYIFCIGWMIYEIRQVFCIKETKAISALLYFLIFVFAVLIYYISPISTVTIITINCLLFHPLKNNDKECLFCEYIKKVLVWLGDISYEIYLIHFPILLVLRNIVKSERLIYFICYIICSITLTLFGAVVLHWIDKKCIIKSINRLRVFLSCFLRT